VVDVGSAEVGVARFLSGIEPHVHGDEARHPTPGWLGRASRASVPTLQPAVTTDAAPAGACLRGPVRGKHLMTFGAGNLHSGFLHEGEGRSRDAPGRLLTLPWVAAQTPAYGRRLLVRPRSDSAAEI
jgi:hypothetical protein